MGLRWLSGSISRCYDFEQMTNLSKTLREKLKEKCVRRGLHLKVTRRTGRANGLWRLMVVRRWKPYIPDGDRGTLCVSSQVGCSLDWFLLTGKQGFNKNLTVAEIIGQVFLAAQSLACL